jgi:hypothetical protein
MSLQKVKTPKRLKEFLIATARACHHLRQKSRKNWPLDLVIDIRYITSRNSITSALSADKEIVMAQTRLFTVTAWLLTAAMAVCAFGGAILCLTLGGLVVMGTGLWMPPEAAAKMAEELHGTSQGYVFLIVGLAVLAGLGLLTLAALIFRALQQIVSSATGGDPFVSQNADRLGRIGWLLVAIYGVQFAMKAVMGLMVPPHLKDHLHFDGFGFDFSPLGALAILLVFVLAQIFRHGSDMRAELEATV